MSTRWIYNKTVNFLWDIFFSRRSIWVLLELICRWTQHFPKIDQEKCKIEQNCIWNPMTTGFIIETLIYISSMEFLSQSCRRSSSRNILSSEERGETTVFAGQGSPYSRYSFPSLPLLPPLIAFFQSIPIPFWRLPRTLYYKGRNNTSTYQCILTISCSPLLCQKKALFSLLPSLQVPGLYFVLKSKPNIRAINAKMDSLYFSKRYNRYIRSYKNDS